MPALRTRPDPVFQQPARAEWFAGIGSGAQISWYNRKARSPKQLDAVVAIDVPRVAASRIRLQVQGAIESERQ